MVTEIIEQKNFVGLSVLYFKDTLFSIWHGGPVLSDNEQKTYST